MSETRNICKNDNCKKTVVGRSDRVFCSEDCKSKCHYAIRKKSGKTYFKIKVDEILRKNRAVLSKLNTKNGIIIQADELEKKGYNSRFFTHYWENLSGERFYFCYDQGIKEMKSSFGNRYTLVRWQKEMERQVFSHR